MYSLSMATALINLAEQLKALGDKTRLEMVTTVAQDLSMEACVCDLTEIAGLSQGTVSHHLKILVETGILAREQRGKWAYYSLTAAGQDLVEKLEIAPKPLHKRKSRC
jgi:ArsR family transcriptional regulator